MTDVEFGKIVRLKRLEQGLSQDGLARIAHVSNATINSIERASRKTMPKTRMALAVALGVDPKEWL